MTSDQFIDLLEQRRLVSERLIVKLREKMAQAERPWTVEALANFLVDKNHLTPTAAAELLEEPKATPPPTGEPDDEDALSLERDADDLIFDLGPYRAPEQSTPDKPPRTPEPEPEAEIAKEKPEHTPSKSIDVAVSHPVEEEPPKKRHRSEPVEETLVQFSEPVEEKGRGAETRRIPSAEKKSFRKTKSEWDSPLLLWGGGGLVLLVLTGTALAFMLKWETGDEQLQAARTALADGSYRQAISDFERFVENHPQHPEYSLARVQLASARLRQAVEGGNEEAALEIAQRELESVEDEEKFNEVQDEFAALLPRIARRLAESAEQVSDPAAADQKVDLAASALTLTMNTKYVPKSLRDDNEIDQIREILCRVAARQTAQKNLATTLAAMKEAVDAGNTRASYEAQQNLLEQHPELITDARLAEMLTATSAAEKAEVRFVREEKPALTDPRPTPWVASLALATHQGGEASSDTGVASILIDGAVYAFDVSTGKLLWRRFVGFDSRVMPLVVGKNVLIGDANANELLLLEAESGRLRWRQQFEGSIAEPKFVGERLYVADLSGKVFVLDLATGNQLGYIQFPQRLRVAPSVDRTGARLYVVGDHSSIYAISLDDLSCLGVYYLGHDEGAITVSPTVVFNRLAILENNGVATCQLHLLELNDRGQIDGSVATERLDGLAATLPLVEGRRLVAITDRGQIRVFDLGIGETESPLTLVADRESSGKKNVIRHAAMAGGSIWLADQQLTQLAILPTGNRLPVRDIQKNYAGDSFDHPLLVFGRTLIHVRRPRKGSGIVTTATNLASGRELWSIEVGVPPGGEPIVSAGGREIVVANANGLVFRLDETALRSRVQDQPLRPSSAPVPRPPISSSLDLGNGRAVFASQESSPYLVLYDGTAETASARWLKLPSPLATSPAQFGTGFLAPLQIGQIFYLQPGTGRPLAAPYQPTLAPRQTVAWQPIGVNRADANQFVITDGHEKIYLVELQTQPEPQLVAIAEADVGPMPIRSAVATVGQFAVAGTQSSDLLRFELPSLKSAEPIHLDAPIAWGPFAVGETVLLVTADQQLICLTSDAQIDWQTPLSHDDLAGEPLVSGDSVLLAYRRGVLEKRSLASGESQGQLDVGQPLEAGPVRFESRIVLPTHDGNLLIVNEP
jgi:outer membrane protein assembly factor BamB